MMNNYLLRYHAFYYELISVLKERVQELYRCLPEDEYKEHETVKLAVRIRKADQEIIPQNPNLPEYYLTGELKKYRRYKQGLKRYRIIFCFSNSPKIILYLYTNTESSLRKAGDKNDPYVEFKKLVKKGIFSHNPSDPNIQKWIKYNRS